MILSRTESVNLSEDDIIKTITVFYYFTAEEFEMKCKKCGMSGAEFAIINFSHIKIRCPYCEAEEIG